MTQPYVLKTSQNKPVIGNLFLSLDRNQCGHTDPGHLQPEEYLVNFPKSSTKGSKFSLCLNLFPPIIFDLTAKYDKVISLK